jgi:hypothetical protein
MLKCLQSEYLSSDLFHIYFIELVNQMHLTVTDHRSEAQLIRSTTYPRMTCENHCIDYHYEIGSKTL